MFCCSTHSAELVIRKQADVGSLCQQGMCVEDGNVARREGSQGMCTVSLGSSRVYAGAGGWLVNVEQVHTLDAFRITLALALSTSCAFNTARSLWL